MRVSNPQDYWKALKNVSKNQNENIDLGGLYEYFKSLHFNTSDSHNLDLKCAI